MQSLAAVPILIVFAIGTSSPFDPAGRIGVRAQGAPLTVVQASCPGLSDLGAGQSTLFTVPLSPDAVWPKIEQALRIWSSKDSDLANSVLKGATFRTSPSLIVEQDPAQRYVQGPAPGKVARTCFYEWRTGNRDSRIAFMFSVRAVARQKTPSSTIELRWLNQTKGAAQRTWRHDPADPGRLRDSLVAYIKKVP